MKELKKGFQNMSKCAIIIFPTTSIVSNLYRPISLNMFVISVESSNSTFITI